jgi:hypothetical protein
VKRFEIGDVIPPPASVVAALQLAPFYQKYVDANGVAVLGSARASNYSLREAAYLTGHLLAGRDNLKAAIVAARVRVAVIARAEHTTDIPEYADLTPAKYWNRRTRGMQATPDRPVLSAGEENLLGFRGDPYHGECCLIHELAHAVHEIALPVVDRSFDSRLRSCYDRSLGQGRWKGYYAARDPAEYWAEGVQSYFDANGNPGGPQHPPIATREALIAYDPLLAALIASVFPDRSWRYTPVARRLNDPHLRGYDPAQSARFTL